MTEARRILTPQQRGRAAEESAASFLLEQGYQIIDRNYRTRWGEIDLVAKENGYLVFIEVRSRRHIGLGSPQETVNKSKRNRLRRLARQYLADHHQFEAVCRFDVVGVLIDLYGTICLIELIREAF